MSLVVAIKGKDRIYVGTDSRRSQGEFIDSIVESDNQKIVPVGDVIIGCVGLVPAIKCLTDNPQWFDSKGATIDKKFIVQNIIPKLYNELDSLNLLDIDDEENEFHSHALIITDKDIFEIDYDFSVIVIDNFVALGATRNEIYPILKNSRGENEEDTILKCLRFSSKINRGIGSPYYLCDSVNKTLRKVED